MHYSSIRKRTGIGPGIRIRTVIAMMIVSYYPPTPLGRRPEVRLAWASVP